MTNKHSISYTQLRNEEWIATRNQLAVWVGLTAVLFMGIYIGVNI